MKYNSKIVDVVKINIFDQNRQFSILKCTELTYKMPIWNMAILLHAIFVTVNDPKYQITYLSEVLTVYNPG